MHALDAAAPQTPCVSINRLRSAVDQRQKFLLEVWLEKDDFFSVRDRRLGEVENFRESLKAEESDEKNFTSFSNE